MRTQLFDPDGTNLGNVALPADAGPGTVIGIDASGVNWEIIERSGDNAPTAIINLAQSARSRHLASVPRASTGLVESSGGVRLALHHIGGKGPTMLICHATGFHALAYTPLARSLVDHFTVWAVDFRGHGASTAPPTGEFPWATMADDVLACVDAIGDDAIFGVGHSMGGAALLLAERTRPGTVRAAYLFEPIVVPADFTRSGQPDDLVRAARGRRREFDSRRAALERYRNRPPLAVVRIDALAAYVEHGFVEADNQVRLACEPESEARTFAAEDKPTHALLNGIDSELTVAYGTLDDSGSPAQFASGIAEILPKTVLRHHPRLSHFGPLEDPDGIAAEITERLSGSSQTDIVSR